MKTGTMTKRWFLTYRGVKLPLQLAEELTFEALRNRNTYFEGTYDAEGRLVGVEKRVYGEVELRHDYQYDAAGRLLQASVTEADEAPRVLQVTPG